MHVSLPLAAWPHFPPLPRLSVYCIHGSLRDIGLRTRLVIIRRILLSLLLKIFVELFVPSQAGSLSRLLSVLGRRKGKLSKPSLDDLIQLSEIRPNYTF